MRYETTSAYANQDTAPVENFKEVFSCAVLRIFCAVPPMRRWHNTNVNWSDLYGSRTRNFQTVAVAFEDVIPTTDCAYLYYLLISVEYQL